MSTKTKSVDTDNPRERKRERGRQQYIFGPVEEEMRRKWWRESRGKKR
jgi:hypothetical protein